MNYAPNMFTSSGRAYTVNVTLMPDLDMYPDDPCVSLDANDIEELSYTSELNSLVMTGSVIYVDKYGLVDRFIEQQQCECEVMLAQNKTEKDGAIVNQQIDEENMFAHTFIVNKIQILDRQHSVIKYKIDLVSTAWYSCIANIAFSNNDSDPESLFSILEKCMKSVGLAVNDTFSTVKTDVKMNYISQVNDNLFKIFQYLMDKLYFWPKKDNSLKFIVYDQCKDEYGVVDITDTATFTGVSQATLSFFKSNAEVMTQAMETNIGSYSNDVSKTDMFTTMFSKDIYEYELSSNKFVLDSSSDDVAIANFMNEHVSYDDYELKYHEPSLLEDLDYFDSTAYWNNPLDMYFKVLKTMYSQEAFTLNTQGQVLRQAGNLVTLAVDRDMNAMTDDSTEELEKIKYKYSGFEGSWIALKVVNVICPKKEMFRQKIALFRNYTKHEKPPDEVVV